MPVHAPISAAQAYENAKQASYSAAVNEYAARVERMFANHPLLAPISTERTRGPVLSFLLDNTEFGAIEEEWNCNECDIEKWVEEQLANRAQGGEIIKFEPWAYGYVQENWPDAFMEPMDRLIKGLREFVDEHGDRLLRHAFVDIDDGDLNEMLAENNLATVDLHIDSPHVRANFIFASEAERVRMRDSVNALAKSLEDDRSAAILDDPANAISLHDNALSLFLERQEASLAEAMSYLGDGAPDPGAALLESVRKEMENIGDAPVALTVLSKVSPDIIYGILKSPSVEILKEATMGLYDQFNGAGSLMGIKPASDFLMPVSMIDAIEIEGGENRMTVGGTYMLARMAWKDALAPGPTAAAPDAQTREVGIAAFSDLVRERMEEREAARPGY